MGVYIRGMTMDDLRIHLRGDDLEYLIAVGHATDVPDHGDLVDMDYIKDHWPNVQYFGAPVVIPEERE